MTTCFVAGIIKGLVEHNDPLRHFASFGGYGHHACAAIAAGLVDVDDSRPCERVKINDAGREYYKAKNLDLLLDTRSYFWDKPEEFWFVAGGNK